MKRWAKITSISFVFVLALALAAAVIGYMWYTSQLQPVSGTDVRTELFVIPKGSTISETAGLLLEKGLIRNDLAFRIYSKLEGFDNELQAGSYELSPSMSTADIIDTFRDGSHSIWVTIPEGLRAEEIAQRIASSNLPEFDEDEFLRLAKPSEGRLFPDTYLLPREITAAQVFNMLTRTFQDKVEVKLADQLQNSSLTLDEIVTLASLVQRESRSPEDMKMVAGVIANRLELGMKLDIDATLSYARGYDSSAESWWSAPSPDLKSLNSPYNTYQVAGLPPAPISNPGLEAILAALDPEPTSALFYLHTPSGQAYYADTYQEHTANIERYLR